MKKKKRLFILYPSQIISIHFLINKVPTELNIDGTEAVRVAHNAILVSRMHLATIALLCKQTTDNFRTHHPPERRWRHLSGNWILFVPHYITCNKANFPCNNKNVIN